VQQRGLADLQVRQALRVLQASQVC
jgi:hypothetical protein